MPRTMPHFLFFCTPANEGIPWARNVRTWCQACYSTHVLGWTANTAARRSYLTVGGGEHVAGMASLHYTDLVARPKEACARLLKLLWLPARPGWPCRGGHGRRQPSQLQVCRQGSDRRCRRRTRRSSWRPTVSCCAGRAVHLHGQAALPSDMMGAR